ncbi:hypothetical protein U1Q18_013848 [Sarracenia purpurea var. burkii]
MAVAVDQRHGFKSFSRPPRCRLQSYSHLDHAMPQLTQTTLAQSLQQAFDQVATIHRSFSTPCLPLADEQFFHANPRIDIIGGHADPRARALVLEVAIAMASGAVLPIPISSGLGGAYFLRGRNNVTIAVAKPIDEEPLAFNNPKGFAGKMLGQPGIKRSIRVGETGLRELAAYLLDHGGFAGVPPTALVKTSHVAFHVNNSDTISAPPKKIASLQQFVEHDSDAGDLGPSSFSVSSIHRIGILDVRLMNLDRHAGNMLVKRGRESTYSAGAAELVPIDHGLCLPEWLDDPYFEWLNWPQASVPFSESEIEYILNLDPFRDAELLRNELPSIRESSIRVLVLCTIFLKQSVAAGLCLADIGEMMTREFRGGEENLCVLESLCWKASASMKSVLNEGHGKEYNREEETEIFQLDNEWEEEDRLSQALDLPQVLFQGPPPPPVLGKPPLIRTARFSSRSMSGLLDATLISLQEYDALETHDDRDTSTINDDNDGSSGGSDGGGKECKLGGLPRSMSFAVSNQEQENGGICLGEISKEEWGIFLENFEKLLPGVFEGRKNMGLMKQRLGSSCEF